MTSFVNSRDFSFLLYELVGAEELTARERFADHTRETFDAVLTTAHQIAEKEFATHYRKSDEHEPTWDGVKVTTLPEMKSALKSFCDAGLMAAQADYDEGGMQLPTTIALAAQAHFHAANIGTAGYALLTTGASNLLRSFGSAEQKARYLMPMLSGRFFGTMALTEPQAGSSLSDIRTTAEPVGDGSYRISGTKIFISGGDQDISENIVHMVLAKIKGAPAGVKGISLFVVPKFHVNDDGSLGERNGVSLAGLIHKLGYRATTSTMLNFGETPCTGYLLGEENSGLAYMFQMMNEARIGVGLGATMLGYAGYLYSLDYARQRPQGRHPNGKDPTSPQVRLVEHADVRRMLLTQKAYVEGALALCLTAARLVDDHATAPDEAERNRASLLLDVLTPIVKAWPSDYCGQANWQAIQILGGYGYTREYPVEQLWRDNRLNPIHEGTNGIQAIDLLGRKVRMANGAAFQLLVDTVKDSIESARAAGGLDDLADAQAEALNHAIATTRALSEAIATAGDLGLANASLYLDLMGRLVIGWIWLKQATIAAKALAAGSGEEAFYRGKLQAARWYARFEVSQVPNQARLLQSLDATTFETQDVWFDGAA